MGRKSIQIADGRPSNMREEEVEKVVHDAIVNGEMLAAVLRTPSGDIAVQMFVNPESDEAAHMADTLEHAAAALRVTRKSLLA